MKEFSPTYLQRSDGRSKRDNIAVGFFGDFVPINELSESQHWMP